MMSLWSKIERVGGGVGEQWMLLYCGPYNYIEWSGKASVKRMTFEQRLKRSERAKAMWTLGKRVPGRGSSKCKGPEAETPLE